MNNIPQVFFLVASRFPELLLRVGGRGRSGINHRIVLLLCLVGSLVPFSVKADYTVDFEDGDKSSYSSGTTTLNGIDWNFTEALVGNATGDIKNGTKAARIRNNGSIAMLADKSGGIGDVTFYYARSDFSGDRSGVAPSFVVEYSNSAGSVWVPFGNETSLDAVDTLTEFTATANVSGDARIRIRQVSGDTGKRWNVDDIVITDYNGGGEPVPPAVGTPEVSSIQEEQADVLAEYVANDAASITEYGFVFSETSLNADPQIGGADVTLLDNSGTPFSPFSATLTGLTISTGYSVRAYVIYEGGTVYSPIVTFTTLTPPPVLDGVTDYTQDFSTFTGDGTLPNGWEVTSSGNRLEHSEWATTDTAVKYSSATVDVFGYQHTGSTGNVTQTLTLKNDTGSVLDAVTISYYGRVERITEGRSPFYTVTVNGTEVASLAYDTASNEDNLLREASVSGLGVADGGLITIIWASSGDSAGSPGSGSRKQIGISDVTVSTGASVVAPSIDYLTLFDGSLTETAFGVDSEIASDGGAEITQRGFLIAQTALEPMPTLETANTTIDYYTADNDPFFYFDYTGLTAGTSYSVRSFATNSAGTTYSSVLEVSTLTVAPSLTAGTPYEESFLDFAGVETLPQGWTAESSEGVNGYIGVWGLGSSGGFLGPDTGAEVGVLGYQHTSSTGTVTVTLRLVNDTGATLTSLNVSYLGRVERVDQTRIPIWTFAVNGTEFPELNYSTEVGEDTLISGTATGLNIADGETFSITWSSDRGQSSGASRQIGIADVSISVPDANQLTAPTVTPASGTYLDVFSVTVTTPDSDVDLYYTLDGSEPSESSSLYSGPVSISESTTFKVAAFSDNPSLDPSPVVTRVYELPIFVTQLSEVTSPILGQLYKISTEVIVTYIDPGGFRGQAYFQDATGGLFMDDDNLVVNAPGRLAVGDGVTGLVGRFTEYNNQIEFQVELTEGTISSTGNTITPITLTLDQLFSSFVTYRYRLVKVINAAFDSADGSATFAAGNVSAISDASGSAGFRTFYSTDYIDTVIPQGDVDIVGIPNSQVVDDVPGNYLSARSLADITEASGVQTLSDYMASFGLSGPDAAADANPSGDGVANIFKFAFGGNPLVSDLDILPVIGTTVISDEVYLTYTVYLAQAFTWDDTAKTLTGAGIILSIEESTNITVWDPADFSLVGSFTDGEIPAGTEVVFVSDQSLDSLPTTFLQIEGVEE